MKWLVSICPDCKKPLDAGCECGWNVSREKMAEYRRKRCRQNTIAFVGWLLFAGLVAAFTWRWVADTK